MSEVYNLLIIFYAALYIAVCIVLLIWGCLVLANQVFVQEKPLANENQQRRTKNEQAIEQIKDEIEWHNEKINQIKDACAMVSLYECNTHDCTGEHGEWYMKFTYSRKVLKSVLNRLEGDVKE